MNSTMRLHLSNLLNKELLADKHDKLDRAEKDKQERPRMFGREITNECLPVRNKSHSRLQSKSFFGRETTTVNTPQPTNHSSNPVQHPQIWCQQLSPYADQIYRFALSQEVHSISSHRVSEYTFSLADSKMRAVLIDWLIDVHLKFKLLPETLFKTTGILDRYLTTLPEITPKKLQLTGVAALFIASKYEQIYPPSTKHYVDILCKAHSMDQLIEMEGKILKTLDFELTFTTMCNYFQRLAQLYKLSGCQLHLPMYLLELSIIDTNFMKYSADILAQASVFLAKVIYKKPTMAVTNEVKQCAKQLLIQLQNAPKCPYQASRIKFSSKTFCEVSTIVIKGKENEKNSL